MICKYCGKEIYSESGICSACEYKIKHPQKSNSTDIYSSSGAKDKQNTFHIENNFREDFSEEVVVIKPNIREPQRRKLSKKGIAIIIIAILLMVGLVMVNSGVFKNPAKEIIKAFDEGRYDAAYTIFVKEYKSTSNEKLNNALSERLGEVYNLYASDKKEYSFAAKEIDTIKKMGIGELAKDIEEAEKKINKLKVSKESFNKAENHYSKGEYNLAITAYRKVILEDSNYKTATDRLNSTVQKYRNTALSEASVYAGEGDYSKGIEILKSAMAILEKDTLIEKRIREYSESLESKGKGEVIEVADKYAYKGDYKSAIESINKVMETDEELKEDKTLNANLEYYKNRYIEKLVEDCGKLIDQGKYEDASVAIKEAEEILGEREELTLLKEEIEDKTPTYLDELNSTDEKKWKFSQETELDSFGNDHSDKQNCIKLSNASYAIYDISDGYEFFSAYVVAAKDIDEAVECRIKATASVGGETRFRECEISADKEAQELKFNVSGCTELKIEIIGEGASIIMYNANLTKPESKEQ